MDVGLDAAVCEEVDVGGGRFGEGIWDGQWGF